MIKKCYIRFIKDIVSFRFLFTIDFCNLLHPVCISLFLKDNGMVKLDYYVLFYIYIYIRTRHCHVLLLLLLMKSWELEQAADSDLCEASSFFLKIKSIMFLKPFLSLGYFKKLMTSYTGMEECENTNTTTKRKIEK